MQVCQYRGMSKQLPLVAMDACCAPLAREPLTQDQAVELSLRESGLITGDRRGTWIYYRVHPEVLARLSAVLTTTGEVVTA
jgi:ArsR family transcriptional regulator